MSERSTNPTELNPELQEVREALRESDAWYRALVEGVDVGIALLDSDHNILMVNEKQLKLLLDRSLSDLIGKKCYREFEGRDDVCPHCPGVKAMATGRPAEVEISGQRSADDKFVVHLKASPVLGPDGRVAGFIEVINDVTERWRLDQMVRQQQQFLAAVLESVQAGIVACNADGVLTLFNNALRTWHGLPAEPLPASEWAGHYDLYLADGKTPMAQEEIPLFQALQGEQVRDVEMTIAAKGQPPRTVIANGQPLVDHDGRRMGAVVAMHDITQRKRSEVAIQASEAKYRQLHESMRDAFVSVSMDGFIQECNAAY
jgi:PAS domain S-box-containing protein